MIVPRRHASRKDGGLAVIKRGYAIRNDIREAATHCHKSKISKPQRAATRPRTSTHCMSTRGITTQQSRDAVMDTAELFEAILLQLPVSDLIKYRSVNRYWFRIIYGSPKLSQKLFLSPTPVDNDPLWIYNHKHNTLAAYTTRNEDIRAITTREQHAAYEYWRKQHFMMRPSVLNPILFTTDPTDMRPSLLRRASLCESIRFRFAPNLRLLGEPNIYHEMFLCQPPVEEVQMQVFYHLEKSTRRGRPLTTGQEGLVVKRAGGVKFKHVLQAFLTHVGPGNDLLPSTGYHIECRPQKTFKSIVYLLGAIFADDGEIHGIGGTGEKVGFSPMAEKMMRRECLVGLEQSGEKEVGAYWSVEDQEWAEKRYYAAVGDVRI